MVAGGIKKGRSCRSGALLWKVERYAAAQAWKATNSSPISSSIDTELFHCRPSRIVFSSAPLSIDHEQLMGSLKKRRKAKIAKHKRRKRMKENRHKKRLRYKS